MAQEVQDIELNREMFDIVDNDRDTEETNCEILVVDDKPTLQAKEDEIIEIIDSVAETPKPAADIHIEELKKAKRRFDSVRSLLEKARLKLMTTKQFWSRSRAQSHQGRQKEAEKVLTDVDTLSQSSPNTPAPTRKEKRNRSFSPVR